MRLVTISNLFVAVSPRKLGRAAARSENRPPPPTKRHTVRLRRPPRITETQNQPEDVGALAAFLCRDVAQNITGANYEIDGGVGRRSRGSLIN
ncbi:hypothetical protein D2V07_01830 [Aurantiacibacter zhengii]|uniref:SDR family oxidoreductase n=1 Tax=Aurantiacibacter zhengii TaxID=2307003 RepID=A0A418NWM6_9SPHN|nr:hypothetical protein D2V07_01830 [Aurantiacibacter zhengii]